MSEEELLKALDFSTEKTCDEHDLLAAWEYTGSCGCTTYACDVTAMRLDNLENMARARDVWLKCVWCGEVFFYASKERVKP